MGIATSAVWGLSPGRQSRAREAIDAPLPQLLIQGGDDRLAVDPATGLNVYGCSPTPRADVLAFSSSTASSISEPAYRRVKSARDALRNLPELSEGFDLRQEAVRRALKTYLGLNAGGADVVFSASGTDAQLHAHFLTQMTLGGPITTIVLGSDQTGSGTVHTSRRHHFSGVTALGHCVAKGAVAGDDRDVATCIDIALIGQDGRARPAGEIDAEVMQAVKREVAAGRKVILQTMDSSKLGWRAPSDACVEAITGRWPQDVQVVVDACQLRSGRKRLQSLLERGAMVLITGSKFFMGPGFSGATLIPRALSVRLAGLSEVPNGLADYMAKYDAPSHWTGLRNCLAPVVNLGAWLRWEAALEEMGAYYALPASFAARQFARIGREAAHMIASSPSLELLGEAGGCAGGEAKTQTVFAFHVKSGGDYLPHEELGRLYRSLNADVAAALPAWASAEERRLAAQACLIGQPVKLGSGRSVLRLALGARMASQSWSDDPATAERNSGNILESCATVVDKINLLVRYGVTGK